MLFADVNIGCLAVSTLTKISDGSEFQPVMMFRGGIFESICFSINLVEMFRFFYIFGILHWSVTNVCCYAGTFVAGFEYQNQYYSCS